MNFGLIFGMGASGLQEYAALSYGVEMTLEQTEMFTSLGVQCRDEAFESAPNLPLMYGIFQYAVVFSKYGSGSSASRIFCNAERRQATFVGGQIWNLKTRSPL